jgi:hypothetical protein
MNMRKLISSLLIITLTFHISSCYVPVYKQVKMFVADPALMTNTISSIILRSGEKIQFNKPGGMFIAEKDSNKVLISGRIEGVDLASKKRIGISTDSILYAMVNRVDPTGTFLASVSLTALPFAVIVLYIALTKQSCPFIYSFNGSHYQFDAEPLGGATTEGLSRTDISALEHLRPVNGVYRLVVRNEVAETQYIDEMKLLIVDHDPQVRPVADLTGTFLGVRSAEPPLSVQNEEGNDVTVFFSAQDSIQWQSPMESYLRSQTYPRRHSLTFSFAKPPGVKKAHLIVHGGTTLWGSNMIRKMYELYGEKVDSVYAVYDAHAAGFYSMMKYMEREELYQLKMSVQKNGNWIERGIINGGGPLIHETQSIPMSVASLEGDRLNIRIQPPAGFWSFDYVGIEYDRDEQLPATEISALSCIDQNGDNVSGMLSGSDRKYVGMPTTSDHIVIEYPVPALRSGFTRSIFLKTSGFYTLHLTKTERPDYHTLQMLKDSPGAVVQYSFKKYFEWYTQMSKQYGERQ